jgi:hypothetical protein
MSHKVATTFICAVLALCPVTSVASAPIDAVLNGAVEVDLLVFLTRRVDITSFSVSLNGEPVFLDALTVSAPWRPRNRYQVLGTIPVSTGKYVLESEAAIRHPGRKSTVRTSSRVTFEVEPAVNKHIRVNLISMGKRWKDVVISYD